MLEVHTPPHPNARKHAYDGNSPELSASTGDQAKMAWAEEAFSKASQAIVKRPATFLAAGFLIGGVVGWLTNKLK